MTDFRFESPLVILALAPVWAGLLTFIFWTQRRSIQWIDKSISPRFRSAFTIYGPITFYAHAVLLLIAGWTLIAAAAGPYRRGTVEVTRKAPYVIMLVDASLSMEAIDVDAPSLDGTKKARVKRVSRFSAAKTAVEGLARALGPEARIGLVSFSGVAAIHIPPTNDQEALREAFGALHTHYFENTGTNFKAAIETAAHFFPGSKGRTSLIILSDGEVPGEAPDLSETLRAVRAAGASIWTVGIGSDKGFDLGIYNPDDLRKGTKKPSIVRQVHTTRDASTLQYIASEADGTYTPIEELDVTRLALAITQASAQANTVPGEGRESLAPGLIAVFFAIFLVELLLLESRMIVPVVCQVRKLAAIARPELIRFRDAARKNVIPRISRAGAALLSLFFLTGCGFDACQAHASNENGILLSAGRAFQTAALSFESSAGYHFREEIPVYNLGNTHMRQGDYSQAHSLFEKALHLKPDFPEALFNDGEALFTWGQREIDPEGCRLERTRQLWKEAGGRFEAAAKHESSIQVSARANAARMEALEKTLDQLEAQCPPEKKKQKEEEDKQAQKQREQEKEEEQKKQQQEQQKQQQNQQKQKQQEDQQRKNPKDQDPAKDKNQKEPPENKDGADGNEPRPQGRGKITPGEAEQIGRELARIAKQKQGKMHNQTRPQQFRAPEEGKKDDGGAGGREVLW